MRRGLGVHKRRNTRRTSHGAGARGRSVSPRPSPRVRRLPDSTTTSGSPLRGQRKASTAPSSPLDNSAAGANPWGNQRGLPSQPGGTVAAVLPVSAPAPAPFPPPPTTASSTVPVIPPATRQQGKANKPPAETEEGSGGESTMGTIFTEWFQKLFAPNDVGSSSNTGGNSNLAGSGANAEGCVDADAVSGNDDSSSKRPTNPAAAVAAGGESIPVKVSSEEIDFPSTKTSAASDFARPQSPANIAPSPAYAPATVAADKPEEAGSAPLHAVSNGDTTSEDGVCTGSNAVAAVDAALAGDNGSTTQETTDERSSPLSTTGPNGKDIVGADEERQQQQPSSSSLSATAAKDDPNMGFLGLFTRGFGGGGSNRDNNSKEKEATGSSSPAASAAVATAKISDNNSAPEAGTTAESSSSISAEGGAAATTAGIKQPPTSLEDGAHSGGGGDGGGSDGAQTAAVSPAGAPAAAALQHDNGDAIGVEGTPEPTAAGEAAGAVSVAGGGGSSPTSRTAVAASEGGPAAGARGIAREGSAGSRSRSTSPSRSQALSVGSDDGEEENLYTAGTHQGAKPSIDDFSSLRVLGKGSYGKVRGKETVTWIFWGFSFYVDERLIFFHS